jgi:hypothetical protein
MGGRGIFLDKKLYLEHPIRIRSSSFHSWGHFLEQSPGSIGQVINRTATATKFTMNDEMKWYVTSKGNATVMAVVVITVTIQVTEKMPRPQLRTEQRRFMSSHTQTRIVFQRRSDCFKNASPMYGTLISQDVPFDVKFENTILFYYIVY